ncbi:MAG: flagellar motor protein MotB [Lachnospiraceae bacterium]|nr:flagellar motor protein MotB [Lachnospiraceae bacterium]
MARKKKEEAPAPGSPAWMATFSDLMNLLLCFFILLFSMSTIEQEKLEAVAASFNQTISIFSGGATAIGDGVLISNGVSQLNELDQYINSTGKAAEVEEESKDALEEFEAKQQQMSEGLAEKVEEAVKEANMEEEIDIDFTSQYVSLTLNGALLFDSGSDKLKEEALPVLSKVGQILTRYGESVIEIEGHTDNVPIHNKQFANNDELSSFRALAVFNYFMENTSLNPAMLKHSGRGEYVPVADNSTPEGRAKNRRVEIKIYHALSTY